MSTKKKGVRRFAQRRDRIAESPARKKKENYLELFGGEGMQRKKGTPKGT